MDLARSDSFKISEPLMRPDVRMASRMLRLNETRIQRGRGSVMMPGRAVVTSSKHTTSDHATLVATVLVGLEGAVHVTSGGRLIASGPVVVVPPLLSVGLRNLMTGRDATSAAHMAGFADLAHF